MKPIYPILYPGMSDEEFAKAVAEGERITEARNREAENIRSYWRGFWSTVFEMWFFATFPPLFAIVSAMVVRALYLFVTTGKPF